MRCMDTPLDKRKLITPKDREEVLCNSGEEAYEELIIRYDNAVSFLREHFAQATSNSVKGKRYRACYPEIILISHTFGAPDSRLSYGHVSAPGIYSTTVSKPRLFKKYLIEQINLLIENHNVPVFIGTSSTPIAINFTLDHDEDILTNCTQLDFTLRDVFDTPDLNLIHDDIVNGTGFNNEDGSHPLALFTAPRVDYSLARIQHYTATRAEHFQKFVLITNYQLYVDKFEEFARKMLADPNSGYNSFVTAGNHCIQRHQEKINWPGRMPQMPACHLTRANGDGISLINIGVGPSNAKTATDHVAVLRPSAWIMLGHCAGLRNSQSLGDYVLAHAYLREDQVLDEDLPAWVPVPALAEIQIAIENAVAVITEQKGFELKKVMRTGTVVSVDNRNWELGLNSGIAKRLSQSRAIGLDMESATVAANGFRFRVPYGALLCVSDKPLHGVLKLPRMANDFFDTQINNHLAIGILAMASLREKPLEFLHSRKLRSFEETAFL